ncbi:hypothetical protein A3D80_03885 [Candidatus Roizmanbacteria bacterium RIFCSPHIGHO2_02_FULL_40_13b]|uniref:Uncharacterized protein n=1 Tax=Candidatus Roizmanbacteria bacterium RIFCSPHIGHO2_01_FULL_39_24 TaxID=1802032 RepID=A0A1F7GMV0_9BACT|nr:MAG: hypothetical protein A2799_00615 [Candidatus Roizmanbacteria bacterium RIFCSPHIGHO2_01_FULL_39_24]OGK27934.1 MAG: hypothetical protein A3D80_03885 [Candidatus Roizmanbacteria bacterium RIFCSPHIGHO2_02_FULL_40_13b]OGK50065.1 MAG: hypothetical protein A3A56_02120 [Candidatus Roizmanbacteria bacterium RIFCSPLOWO2_01_FULL_40_32]OGK57099.1 MAG: hypothetical protein A3H83_04185 [Candidatus Roizmanbacteria bacterium RIFCSPLOWO2_02_FULL_39_8]
MSLSLLSYYFRKVAPFVIIGVLIFIGIFGITRVFFSVKKTVTTPSTINKQFGALAPPIFNHKIGYPAGATFALDNIEGRPTTATDEAKVYFIPPIATKFGYAQKIYSMAKNAGFNTKNVSYFLDGTHAIFEDSLQKITIDISYFNFEYKYAYENHPELFLRPSAIDETTVKERAADFFRLLGKYPNQLSLGTQNITYMHYNSETKGLDVVTNPKLANVVEVDFFRADIQNGEQTYPVVSPKYYTSENYVVMTLDIVSPKIIKAQMHFFETDDTNTGVYPLKTGDEAWAQFLANKGTIVTPGGGSYPITIKKMFLAYYETDVYESYLQPLYVFLGENNFVAYVSAVKN